MFSNQFIPINRISSMSRYAVTSDWHLSSGDIMAETTDRKLLYEFLKWCETEVDKVYLAGDIFDMRLTTLDRIRKANYPVADKALELVDKGKAVYCPGNHDWPLIEEYWTTETADMDGTGIVVLHGHQFDPVSVPFWLDEKREKWIKEIRDKTGYTLWPDLEKRKKSKRLSGTKDILMRFFTRRAERFARNGGYRGVIYGHMHLPGIYSEDPLIANSGCCIGGDSDYLVVEDGEVVVKDMKDGF